jgi:hypothetical protein
MNATELIDNLKTELDALQARLAVDDEMMHHLSEIYFLAFSSWYDPDNQEHRKWGDKLWPHISALNKKLHFKR